LYVFFLSESGKQDECKRILSASNFNITSKPFALSSLKQIRY